MAPIPAPSRTIKVMRLKVELRFILRFLSIRLPSRFRSVSYIITPMEANGTYTFTMLFEPAEEGGYVVTCPALPGLVTEGDTMEDARQMAEDALRRYLESLLEDGLSIPPDKTPIAEPVEIALAS
jgi:antitoxin HicB